MMRYFLVAALLLAPATTAFSLQVQDDEMLELGVGNTTTLDFTVTADCPGDFVSASSTSITATISSADVPEDWGFSADDVTLDGSGCTGATVSGTGTISFTPSDNATGLVGVAPTFTATSGSMTADATRENDIYVQYVPGHTMETDITFPYDLMEDTLTFNVTIEIQANANSMVMFLNVGQGGGTLSGLGHEQFFFDQGQERTRVKTVTWEAPQVAWTQANITFDNYSHCLGGGPMDACDPQLEQEYVWTINNAMPAGSGSEEEEDSPGAGILMTLALIGAVVIARRR